MPTIYEVTSNYQWRNFLYRNEVPQNVLDGDLDWTDEENDFDGYFQYYRNWYQLGMFMRDAAIPYIHGGYWDGIHSDSFFSGVVIKLSRDVEQYQVGTVISRSMYIEEIAEAIVAGEMHYEDFQPHVQVDIDQALERIGRGGLR